MGAWGRSLRGETPLEGPRHRGARRRERADIGALLSALVDAPEPERVADPAALGALLPAGFTVLEPLGARTLRVQVADGDAVVHVAPPGPGRLSGARRAHRASHALRLAGVEIPRVLGFAESRARPAGAPSFVVTEHLAAPPLAVLAASGVLGDPGERRRCALACAHALGALHRAGWVHPGLEPDRVLVLDRGVVLTRLSAARRDVSDRARAHDLLRLLGHPDVREVAGPVERLRFLRAYLGPVPGAAEVRARWVARLEAEAGRRARRDLAAAEAPV